MEGWHNKFNRSLCVTHRSIWKIIDALQKDSAANHLSIVRQTAGQAAPPQKRRYRVIDQQIANIVGDYGNRNAIDFKRYFLQFSILALYVFQRVFFFKICIAFNNILIQYF